MFEKLKNFVKTKPAQFFGIVAVVIVVAVIIKKKFGK